MHHSRVAPCCHRGTPACCRRTGPCSQETTGDHERWTVSPALVTQEADSLHTVEAWGVAHLTFEDESLPCFLLLILVSSLPGDPQALDCDSCIHSTQAGSVVTKTLAFHTYYSCTDLEGMESQWPVRGLVLNPWWAQDLNKDNVPCLRSMPNITLLNPPCTVIL
jgi:hypothetical protein